MNHKEEMDEILQSQGDQINEIKTGLMKRTGGPLKFETPQKLQKLFRKYFDETPFELWTVSGLALACGSTSSTIKKYKDRAEYKAVVEKAWTMIENSYEVSMRIKGRSVEIFAMKQFGWRDVVDSNVNHTGVITTGINWIASTPPSQPVEGQVIEPKELEGSNGVD